MATELSNAFDSLHSGRYTQARDAFRDAVRSESNKTFGFLGLAAAGLAMGNLRDAASFAEKSLQESRHPEGHLLLAEIYSRMGQRLEAEEQIEEYFAQAGEQSPYGLALRGEQRIRTARWNEGIDDYLAALQRDREGRAYAQLQGVLADLVDAVHSGKLPAEPARQFVDRIERRWAGAPGDAETFFDTVRRALDSGTTIPQPADSEPIFGLLEQLDPGPDGQSPPPPTASSSPDSSEHTSDEETGIQPKKKNLARVIQGDRDQNEQLQNSIGTMAPPDWPSSPDYGEIDPIESLAWEEQSIFADSPGMDSTDFRITSGSVRAEIFLERCLQNLLKGAKRDRAVSVRFRPEAITRIEVNCWDGLLSRIPELSDIYAEFHEAGKYEQFALGRFIGECVAVPFDGTWEFAEPPENSRLIVGNERLDPLELAGRWIAASSPDEVELESIGDRARRASERSTSLGVEQNYIDPTREVEGHSLDVKLAELWARYLFRLADASFAELAETVETLEIEPGVIIFEMDPEHCPEPARGPNDSAMRGERVPLAYLRERGEFLLLASRKHAARTVQAALGKLDGDRAKEAAGLLADYHRASWVWVRNRETARRLEAQTGTDLDPPTLVRSGGSPALEITAVSENQGAIPLRLVAPNDGSRWRLEGR